MVDQKTYTAASGTKYTQVNDSTYNWQNGAAEGHIYLRPNSGGPIGDYKQYLGSGVAPEYPKMSQDYVERHVDNINSGLNSDQFKVEPSFWENIRNILGKGLIKVGKKISTEEDGGKMNYLHFLKYGGIHIKPENKGKFTSYCGGKVTEECIQKGKRSKNPLTRKRATFAANSRAWAKKQSGGKINYFDYINGNFNIDDPNIYRKEGGKINYLNYLGTTYKIDISAENVSKWAGGAVATRLSPFKQDSSKIYEQYLSFDPYENDLSLYNPNPQDSTEGEQEKVKVEQEKVEVPTKTTSTKPGSWKEFRDTLIAALQKKGFTGEAAQTLVAQMGLETGHGKHMSGDYNYGNITAGKNWSGKTVQKVDNHNGKTYSFRSYDDLDQAMNDYVNLLTRSYGVTPQDTKDQIYAKLTGGNQRGRKWAEAQNYTQNIDSVYNMYWK